MVGCQPDASLSVTSPILLVRSKDEWPFCFLLGASTPFDEETLDRLYQHHALHVIQVAVVAGLNLADGYITRRDALRTFIDAAISPIGR